MPGQHLAQYNLAQYNVARARWPMGSPELADFFAQVPGIHALADASPGFVWRSTEPEPDPYRLSNLTVWESMEALKDFTYRSAHVRVFRDRARWFEKSSGPYQVLWWAPVGTRPSLAEGDRRLIRLQELGPHPGAFTFAETFAAPGESD